MSELYIPKNKCSGYGHVLAGYWQDETGGVHKCTYAEMNEEGAYEVLLREQKELIARSPQDSRHYAQESEALLATEAAIKVYEEGANILPRTPTGVIGEIETPLDTGEWERIEKEGTVTYIPILPEEEGRGKGRELSDKQFNDSSLIIGAVAFFALLIFGLASLMKGRRK